MRKGCDDFTIALEVTNSTFKNGNPSSFEKRGDWCGDD
jgi:hypothetical protein